jgi:hypothetical protein
MLGHKAFLISTALLCLAGLSSAQTATLKEGSYQTPTGPQKYFYAPQGQKYGVLFEPALPRSDTALIMAVNELAPKLLSVTTANCRPALEGKTIAFRCARGNVFVMVIKDDQSGQVTGFTLWGQRL